MYAEMFKLRRELGPAYRNVLCEHPITMDEIKRVQVMTEKCKEGKGLNCGLMSLAQAMKCKMSNMRN